MISSKPNYFPKTLPPDTITLGIKASAYGFWGDANIPSIEIVTTPTEHLDTHDVPGIILITGNIKMCKMWFLPKDIKPVEKRWLSKLKIPYNMLNITNRRINKMQWFLNVGTA